jgi:DNA-binding XRE family transcriptional regulator
LDLIIFNVGKSAESWTLSFLLAKKVRKVGLCHFYWRKKLGKFNFVIFNSENDAESWTLSLLMAEKFGK